jgi:hypothetical protein
LASCLAVPLAYQPRTSPRALQYWGVTPEERAHPFPCDRFVSPPHGRLFRGGHIDAPKELVYRWLCQLSVAPYSYDWVDNLGRRSPPYLIDGAEQLEIGQRFLIAFTLVDFEPDRSITVRIARFKALMGEVAITYLLVPESEHSCKLIMKTTAHCRPDLPSTRYLFIPWGEFLMSRKQFMTLRRLCESHARAVDLIDAKRAAGNGRARREPALAGAF